MAIGILSALDGIQGEARPDDNSVVPPIDRLASLPQALIMQMAQKGQIPKTMVAPVLAKKAENAQLGMQMQAAMQKAQAGAVPPSTVIEKVIAQNAAQEAAPMNRSNVGIASAPMRPDMYRRGMAGGGIVAFQEGGGTFMGNLADRIFGDSLSQYGKSIDRAGALRRKQKFERIYGPDAVNFEEYNNALIELGIDPKSDLGGGVLAKTVPDFMDRTKAEEIKAKYEAVMPTNRAFDYVEYRDAIKALDLPLPPRKPYNTTQPKDGPLLIESRGVGAYDFGDPALDEARNLLDKSVTPYKRREPTKEELNKLKEEVFPEDEKAPSEPTIGKDAGLDETAVDKKDSGADKLVDDALKGIEDDRKPKSSGYDEFAKKASKLSGEELAMLGLEFGLNLMGTKEKDFLTAVGQSGKPALKTALARQAERRKEARESKMMDKKFKNQQALLQEEIKSREKIGDLDRKSRETIAAVKLKEVLARLDLSEKNADKALIQAFIKDIANDSEYMVDQLNLRVVKDPDERKKIIARMDRRAQEIIEARMRIFSSFGVGNTSGGGSGSEGSKNKEVDFLKEL